MPKSSRRAARLLAKAAKTDEDERQNRDFDPLDYLSEEMGAALKRDDHHEVVRLCTIMIDLADKTGVASAPAMAFPYASRGSFSSC